MAIHIRWGDKAAGGELAVPRIPASSYALAAAQLLKRARHNVPIREATIFVTTEDFSALEFLKSSQCSSWACLHSKARCGK